MSSQSFVPTAFDYTKWMTKAPEAQSINPVLLAGFRQNINTPPPQVDLGGINSFGDGIAKGLGNIANAVIYHRQQKAQQDYLSNLSDGLAAKEQAQQAQQQQLLSQAVQQHQQEQMARYNTGLAVLGGDTSPQTLAAAQVYGIGNPASNLTNALGTTQGNILSQGLKDRVSPTFNQGAPTPDTVNRFQAIQGFAPTTNLSLAQQQEQLNSSRLGNATAGYNLGVQPQLDKQKLESGSVDIAGKKLDNYFKTVTTPIEVALKQADAELKKLGTGQAAQKYNDLQTAQQLLLNAQKTGDLFDPQKIPALSMQLQSLGSPVNLLDSYKNLYNPKAGEPLADVIVKNAPPKPGLPTPQQLEQAKAFNARPQQLIPAPRPSIKRPTVKALVIAPSANVASQLPNPSGFQFTPASQGILMSGNAATGLIKKPKSKPGLQSLLLGR
jgi:hypothetical protein